MQLNDDTPATPKLDYESWRAAIRSYCCQYNARVDDSERFTGTADSSSLYGLLTADISCNAQRIERTPRDIRLDQMDHYYVIVQTAGQSAVIQNDRTVDLTSGNMALIDTSRPLTYIAASGGAQWLSLKLPRTSLITQFGFEPQGGADSRNQAVAGRLLMNILNSVADDSPTPAADGYMKLAIYDLLGALFAPSDQPSRSIHTDRLFRRICDIVKDRFSDRRFGPCDIAAEVGISQRYLQTLFTARGLVCNSFIQSIRLDNAARLLHRRAMLNTGQPLSEIAYACGFNDYGNFARRFRRRFGHSPSIHVAER